MSEVKWKSDVKGRLFAEVDVKAKPGTKEYEQEMFDKMHEAMTQIEEVMVGDIEVKPTEDNFYDEEDDEKDEDDEEEE